MSFLTAEVARKSVMEQLGLLSSSEIARRSATVTARLIQSSNEAPIWPVWPVWKDKTVAIFRSLKKEIQLSQLDSELSKNGAKLCYPRITDSASGLMQFVHVDDPSNPENWEPGPYSGLEPRAGFPVVEADTFDIIVVPGLCFGRSGERIGRGKGFYDRFLAGNQRARRIVLCFDFQLFPSLPQKSWDQRVHWIVTETEFVKVNL